MKVVLTANKEGKPSILEKLKEIEKRTPKNSRGKYISFPVIFKSIGGAFCLRKEEIWNKMYLLRELKLIKIIPFHGIVLRYRVEVAEDD